MSKNLVGTSKYFPACMLLENVCATIFIKIIFIVICCYFLELSQITGIAAILRFPMPELEDDEDDDDSDEFVPLPPS